MSRHTKEFDFSVGDKILLREIQRPGRIEILQVDSLGVQYRVSYWDNSERKIVWLYPEELEAR